MVVAVESTLSSRSVAGEEDRQRLLVFLIVAGSKFDSSENVENGHGTEECRGR